MIAIGTAMLLFALTIVTSALAISYAKVVERYAEQHPDVLRIKARLSSVFPDAMRNLKMYKGDSSYTLDKEKIFLCTEHDGVRYDDNMLTYVAIHELAHILNRNEVGHGPSFNAIFDRLLARATVAGIYDPTIPKAERYCPTTTGGK